MTRSESLKPHVFASLGVLLVTAVLATSPPPVRAAGTLSVDFTDYYLSVRAENAEVNDVFREIESRTGVWIVLAAPVEGPISVDFTKKGFTRGMKLIVSALGPDEYRGDFQLGKTFTGSTYTIRKVSEAERSAKRAQAASLNAQAEALLKDGKDYQAYGKFIAALRVDPTFLPAHKNLVRIYDLWEAYGKQSERLEKVVNIEPENPDNYERLAEAYRRDFRLDKAIKAYERFLSKFPRPRAAEQARTRVTDLEAERASPYARAMSEVRTLIDDRKFEEAEAVLRQLADGYPGEPRTYDILATLHELKGDYQS